MTLVLKVDGVEVVGRVKMGEVAGLPTAAWYGEPMTGGLIIEDLDGTLDLSSWHYFTADEDDCVVGGTRLFTGWITGVRIRRGNEKHATARIWDCDVLEVNGLFGLEVLRGGDASRPAETDVERLTWLIAANAMDDTPVADLGRFSTSGPINLSETNFVKSFPMEVLVPTAGVAGKNAYAYWSDDDDALGLHYDLTATGPSAAVAISNDMADVDDVDTFYPYLDGELERDPSEMATGILLNYRNGAVYAQNTTLIDDLSPTEVSPSAFKRDQVIDSDRIGSPTTAQAYVERFLEQRDRPKEILRFTVRLPATKVNAIHAGDVLSCRFTHLPNLDPAANRMVTRRTVTQSEGRRDYYDLALECADYEIVAPGGGDTGELPAPDCTPQLVQSFSRYDDITPVTLDNEPTPGNLLVMWIGMGGTVGEFCDPDGFTGVGADWVSDPATGAGHKDYLGRFWYRVVEDGDTDTITFTDSGGTFTGLVSVSEWTHVDTLDDYVEVLDDTDDNNDPMVWGAGPVTLTPGVPVLLMVGILPSLNANDTFVPFDTTGGTELATSGVTPTPFGNIQIKNYVGYRAGPKATDTIPLIFTIASTPAIGISRGWMGLMPVFIGSACTDACPTTGQWRRDEFVAVGDDSTMTFATECPYADRSLRVRVDGMPVVIGLTETDPATGSFTLDFAPRGPQGDAAAETIYVDYQGR